MNLKGKVVWITGASSGIGEALAVKLAAEQARLVLSSRRTAELQRVAGRTKLSEKDVMILPFDLQDTSNAVQLAEEIVRKFGRIDVLINNGGFSQRSEVLDTPMTIDRQIMEADYFAPVALTKAALPLMVKNGTGKIVVISSIAGKFGFYLRSSYSAAKHALHGFFETLRLETEEKGISVLMVCPGKINTNVALNAITASGTRHEKSDKTHLNAMTADDCAAEIVKAMRADKAEILVGGRELLLVRIRRYFPWLFEKLVRRERETMN